jgi:hypothetical protein
MAMSVELVCVQFRTAFGYGTVGCMSQVSGLHVYRDTFYFYGTNGSGRRLFSVLARRWLCTHVLERQKVSV